MVKRRLLSALVALSLVPWLSGCSSTPHRESVGEFLDSSLITAKVKTRLVDDRITGGFFIKVYTYKGTVRLSGYVNSSYEKSHATKVAQGVNGVKQVNNLLVVRAEQP